MLKSHFMPVTFLYKRQQMVAVILNVVILTNYYIAEIGETTSLSVCSMTLEKIILTLIWATKLYFWKFQLYQMLDIVPSCILVQYQGKLMM